MYINTIIILTVLSFLFWFSEKRQLDKLEYFLLKNISLSNQPVQYEIINAPLKYEIFLDFFSVSLTTESGFAIINFSNIINFLFSFVNIIEAY